jgi:WD40 repeat protein
VVVADVGEKTTPAVLKLRAGTVEDLAWSADGTYLAIVTINEPYLFLYHINPKCSQIRSSGARVGQRVTSIAWSPFGTLLAAVTTSDRVQVWEAATLAEPQATQPQHSYYIRMFTGGSNMAWSPNGRLLATAEEHCISIFEVYSDRKLATLKCEDPRLIGWMPDGEHIVARGRYDGNILLWRIKTESPISQMHITVLDAILINFFEYT